MNSDELFRAVADAYETELESKLLECEDNEHKLQFGIAKFCHDENEDQKAEKIFAKIPYGNALFNAAILAKTKNKARERAMQYLKEALNYDQSRTFLLLGLYEIYANPTKRTSFKNKLFDAAFYIYQAAAMNNRKAQCLMGIMYLHGLGVRTSEDEAIKWLSRSQKRNNAVASYLLAEVLDGSKSEEEKEEALSTLMQALRGDNTGLRKLGDSFQNHGKSLEAKIMSATIPDMWPEVSKRYQHAAESYLRAADNGDKQSVAKLAQLYRNPLVKTSTRQRDHVCDLLQKTAEEDSKAQLLLGDFHKSKYDYKEALLWYQRAAENDDSEATYKVGTVLEDEYGADPVINSYQWIYQAAKMGNPDAQYQIGKDFLKHEAHAIPIYCQEYKLADDGKNRISAKQLNADGMKWLGRAAKQNHSLALIELADIYRTGDLVDKDLEKAISYLREALTGSYKARFELAQTYAMAGDYVEAQKWYKESYKSDPHSNTAYMLGVMSFEGRDGIDVNYHEAMEWFLKAQKVPNSHYYMGLMHEFGLGVPVDDKKALDCFAKAEKEGSFPAIMHLAKLHEDGRIVKKDLRKALSYYKVVARLTPRDIDQAEIIEASSKLGDMYLYGRGALASYKEAMRHYFMAAQKGDNHSRYQIANMHIYGMGCKADIDEAVKWFLLGDKDEYAPSQRELALIYLNGTLGHFVDPETARMYMKKAADGEDAKARNYLAEMLFRGIGGEKNEEEAYRLFTLAAEEGNPEAEYNMALAYLQGLFVDQNDEQAYRLFKRARSHGLALDENIVEWMDKHKKSGKKQIPF